MGQAWGQGRAHARVAACARRMASVALERLQVAWAHELACAQNGEAVRRNQLQQLPPAAQEARLR